MPDLIETVRSDAMQVADGNGATVSTVQLTERADRLAESFVEAGVRCVGINLDNGPDWLCAELACAIAGIPCVPLPLFFTSSQLAHLAKTTGMDAIVGTGLPDDGHFSEFLRQEGEFPWWLAPARDCRIPAGIAKVTFTSGTTGLPKGVCLTGEQQTGVACSLAEATADLGLGKHLVALPLAVLLENVAGVHGAWFSGSDVVVPPLQCVGLSGSSIFDPTALAASLIAHRPESVILLPQMLKALVGHLERREIEIDSLRFVAVGGARTAPELIARARGVGLPVFEGYGLTEAGSVVCVNLPGADRPGSVGRPLPGRKVRIGDDGVISVFLPRGVHYLGLPPIAPGWFSTGDVGRVDSDGYLAVNGRAKEIIVTSFGRNVSPEWVESELLAEPGLAQAYVFGEDQPALAALLVPAPGVDGARVSRAVRQCNLRLPDYARVKAWHTVPPFTMESGQATANGRPARCAIRAAHHEVIERLQRKIEAQFMESPMDFYQQLLADTEAERRVLLEQPVITECLGGNIEHETYLGFLEQAYHHVKHTVPLLMACGARLPDRLEWLREAVAEYIEEETGHQEWILNDIKACGGDAEQVRHGKPHVATDVMVAYAWDCVLRRNPVAFFGMVLVLEGTSVKLASAAADIIQRRLELPDQAFSYLRSHGALDQEHIEFYERLVNHLDRDEDRAAIRDAARVMYRLYANVFSELPGAANRREAA